MLTWHVSICRQDLEAQLQEEQLWEENNTWTLQNNIIKLYLYL